jgi:hypothetical protein
MGIGLSKGSCIDGSGVEGGRGEDWYQSGCE